MVGDYLRSQSVYQDVRAQLLFSLRQSEITAAGQTEHLNIGLNLRKHRVSIYKILPDGMEQCYEGH